MAALTVEPAPMPGPGASVADRLWALLPDELTTDLAHLVEVFTPHGANDPGGTNTPDDTNSVHGTDNPGGTHNPGDPGSGSTGHPGIPTAGRGAELDATGALVKAARGVVGLSRWAEATLTDLAAVMALQAGRHLLKEQGIASPSQLSATKQKLWRAGTKSLVAHELQTVTGYGIRTCHDRVGFALAPPHATAVARGAMLTGKTGWWEVSRWWHRCHTMTPNDAGTVATEVFDQRRSRAQITQVLDRAATRVEGHDPHAARQRRTDAVDRRGVWATLEGDGTGTLTVTGRTSTIVAALDRIESAARRTRATGDPRTLNQLRSDTTLALLMAGTITTHSSGTDGPGTDTLSSDAQQDSLASLLAGLPPATVNVTIPLDVLTGTNPHAIGKLTGPGPLGGHLDAEQARELLLTPGTVLYRLVTDPLDGTALQRSVKGYVPDQAMRDLIHAADQSCRAPGCTVPAAACDADHATPYPDGPTSATNLVSLHRGHHNQKTQGHWHLTLHERRHLRWTTLFGATYTTQPYDHRHLTNPPPAATAEPAGESEEHSAHHHELRLVDSPTAPPGTAAGSQQQHRPPGPVGPELDDATGRSDDLLGTLLQAAGVLTPGQDLQDQLIYAALTHRHRNHHDGQDNHDGYREGLAADDDEPLPTGWDINLELHHHQGSTTRTGPPPGHPTPEQLLNPTPRPETNSATDTATGDDPPPF